MLLRLTPIVAIALLSGCSLTKGEQYHQETLAAIQNSEANVNNRITNLELQLSNQSDYIDSLEEQVDKLQVELLTFRDEAMAEVKKTERADYCPISRSCGTNPNSRYCPWLYRKGHCRVD